MIWILQIWLLKNCEQDILQLNLPVLLGGQAFHSHTAHMQLTIAVALYKSRFIVIFELLSNKEHERAANVRLNMVCTQ